MLLLFAAVLIVIPCRRTPSGSSRRAPYIALAPSAHPPPWLEIRRYSVHSSMIALLVFCISATPLLRAFEVGDTLPARLNTAFGEAVPRAVPNARALIKPITLRLIYEAPPAPNVEVNGVIYASRTSGFLKLDLYKSTSLSSPRPLVIVVHGGSWNGGDREDLPDLNFYPRHAATQSVPSATDLPGISESCSNRRPECRDYLPENNGAARNRPAQIVLLGRSAGGHLALLSAYKNGDPAIRGVIALYPPTDQIYGYQIPSRVIDSHQILQDYLGGTPLTTPIVYLNNSPVRFVNSQSPPTLLIHGTKDELVSVRQSQMLQERLAAAGRPNMLLELPWATTGATTCSQGRAVSSARTL